MKIPTIQKQQILQERGSYQVADPNAARARGEAISQAARGATAFAKTATSMMSQKNAKEDRIATDSAKDAFQDFTNKWEESVRRGEIPAKKYKEAYTSAYNKHFGDYFKDNTDNLKGAQAVTNHLKLGYEGKVAAEGFLAEVKALDAKDRDSEQASNARVTKAPNSFETVLYDAIEKQEARFTSGELSRQQVDDRVDKVSSDLAKATIQGYIMQGKHKEGLDFVRSPEVVSMLGTDATKKLHRELIDAKRKRETDAMKQEEYKYNQEQRKTKKDRENELLSSMEAVTAAETGEGVYQARESVGRKLRELGYTGTTKATGYSEDKLAQISATSTFGLTGKILNTNTPAGYTSIRHQIYKKQADHSISNADGVRLLKQLEIAENTQASDPMSTDRRKAAMALFNKSIGITHMEELMNLKGKTRGAANNIMVRYSLLNIGADTKGKELENMRTAVAEERLFSNALSPLNARGTSRVKDIDDVEQALYSIMQKQFTMPVETYKSRYRELMDFKRKLSLEEELAPAKALFESPHKRSKSKEAAAQEQARIENTKMIDDMMGGQQ